MSAALYRRVIDEHHARLERLSEKRGVNRLRRVYMESQAEVAAKLKQLVRGGKGSTFDAHHKRLVLAQLQHGQRYVMGMMSDELASAAHDTRTDVLRALPRDIARLERSFTGTAPILPVEDAARFQGVLDDRRHSLLRRHEESLTAYGQRNVVKVEDELSKSLLQGESQHEAIDRVTEALDTQWWQGERIVRTELAHAASVTQADGIEAAREVIPDLMMQWRELVTDEGVPLDDRVGLDSLAMHLQVAIPGEMFTCPAATPKGEDVPEGLVYKEVDYPPLRPNGRETLAPWRSGWAIPAWRYVNGRRVPMR